MFVAYLSIDEYASQTVHPAGLVAECFSEGSSDYNYWMGLVAERTN